MPNEICQSLHIQEKYFDLIRSGSKTIEVRLNDGVAKSVKSGEKIRSVLRPFQTKAAIYKMLFQDCTHRLSKSFTLQSYQRQHIQG